MKTFRFLLPFILFSLGFLSACEKINDDINPIDIRTDYVGTWIATETDMKGVEATYTVRISVDGTHSSQVILQNFMNLGSSVSVSAIVTEGTITVPLQTVDSWTISGTGTLAAVDEIQWSRCSANQIAVRAVYRRQ